MQTTPEKNGCHVTCHLATGSMFVIMGGKLGKKSKQEIRKLEEQGSGGSTKLAGSLQTDSEAGGCHVSTCSQSGAFYHREEIR